MIRKALLSLGLATLVVWAHTTPAFALTITPIRYEIAGDPGQTLDQEITLVNESDKSQLYYVSFANFEAQGDTGSPNFVEPKDDIGTWMSTSQSSINIGAGEQKKVTLKITIPKDATPGGHFGAIFWGTSPGAKPGEVSIGTKTGLLVLLTVSGPITESAGLVDFQTTDKGWFYKQLPIGFQYRFSNQGSDRVKPEGNVVVRSILGWRVARVNANPSDGNVLPNTTRKFNPEWVKTTSFGMYQEEVAQKQTYSFIRAIKDEWRNFAVGVFSARVVATFGANDSEVKSNRAYFVVFPWELLLIIAIIGTGAYYLLRTLIRRHNRSIIKKAEQLYRQQSTQ